MFFVSMTITGVAPRSFWSEAPGPDQITAAISGALASDGFQAPQILTTAAQTGLFSGDNPYSVAITVQAGDGADPTAILAQVSTDVAAAVGQPPQSALVTGTSSTPPTAVQATGAGSSSSGVSGWLSSLQTSLAPIASAFNIDVQFVILGLVALLALAIIVLAPELKAGIAA